MDPRGRTPLHYAALENNADLVAVLLNGGAEVDAADNQGFTALHMACQQWAVEAARELLAAGASVDSVNVFGNTPLFVAVFNSRGRGELIQTLREHGANSRHVNNAGQSPVGLARTIGNYDVAQFFADLPP